MIVKKVLAQVTIPDYSGVSGWKLPPRPTLGTIASAGLKYALVFAGLSMFGMILYGGFHLLISRGNPEGIKEGTNKIVFGIIGFLVVFAAYWIIQLIEAIFHFSIL